MSLLPTSLTPSLYAYYQQIGFRDHPVLTEMRHENAQRPQSNLQAAPEVAHLLAFLVKLLGAKDILEVGTFRGYSTLAMALALPQGGHITTLDSDARIVPETQQYWDEAEVLGKITLHLGDGIEMLQHLKNGGSHFDMAFIDANKNAYDDYYELCLELIHSGGVIVLDNTLWRGDVAADNPPCPQSKTLKALNEKIHGDPRVEMLMLPISDGVTVVRKCVLRQ